MIHCSGVWGLQLLAWNYDGCIGACQALDHEWNTFANCFAPNNETLPGIEWHFSEHETPANAISATTTMSMSTTSSATGSVSTSAKATGMATALRPGGSEGAGKMDLLVVGTLLSSMLAVTGFIS